MKKKICFFSGDITRSGGTERVSVQLANELVKEDKYEICFLSLVEQADQPFYEIDKKIERDSLGNHWINPGPGYLPLIGKLRTFLKQKKIDIIIDIDIVLDVLSIPAAKRLKTKVISWEHFTADFELSVLYRRWILRYSIKRSDFVVVLTKGDLEEYCKKLKRTKNICQIYNIVEAPDASEITCKNRKKQILTIGRLVPEKGIERLKQISLEVLKKHPDWEWLILGDGKERKTLEEFIKENQLESQLILLGYVSNVNEYLLRASILVSTSEYEGLGMNILEARSMGVPCVSFAVKMGPLEVIHNELDGYLIDPFDNKEMVLKINRLIEDSKLRTEFAEKALEYMSEFRSKKIIKQWNEILK